MRDDEHKARDCLLGAFLVPFIHPLIQVPVLVRTLWTMCKNLVRLCVSCELFCWSLFPQNSLILQWSSEVMGASLTKFCLETPLQKVEAALTKVEKAIEDAETKAVEKPEDLAYWREEKRQLREEKRQLREEKRQLREEKLLLLQPGHLRTGTTQKQHRTDSH
jgi:hypothetical protein